MREVLDVRRFTALDMHGTAGTLRRRRIIRAEFVIGCPIVFVFAVVTLHAGHPLLGGWVLGIAVNYLPLAAHSLSLFPPGRLEAELAGVEDVRGQLMRAGALQFLLLVPFRSRSVVRRSMSPIATHPRGARSVRTGGVLGR